MALVLVGCNNTGENDVPTFDAPITNEEIIIEAVEEAPTQPIIEMSMRIFDYAPCLYVSTSVGQRIQAMRSVGFWMIYDENGNIVGESPSGSPARPVDLHPSAFDDAILRINDANSIELEFSGDYPPQRLYAMRWPVKYLADSFDYDRMWDTVEDIGSIENIFHITNNGYDYLYEILASWTEGSSQGWAVYFFSTTNGGDN